MFKTQLCVAGAVLFHFGCLFEPECRTMDYIVKEQ